MSSATHDWKVAYLNYLEENISTLGALMIIDNNGEILAHKISPKFEKEYDLSWLRDVAKKVSRRFKIADFHKEMEGLQLTINIFKKYEMLVRSLNYTFILIMIIPASEEGITYWMRRNAPWLSDEFRYKNDFVKGLEFRV